METETKLFEVKSLFIAKNEETAKLYELEEQLHSVMSKTIHEWMKISGIDKKEYWTVGLPTALYDLMNSWEGRAGTEASISYLHNKRFRGFEPSENLTEKQIERLKELIKSTANVTEDHKS